MTIIFLIVSWVSPFIKLYFCPYSYKMEDNDDEGKVVLDYFFQRIPSSL